MTKTEGIRAIISLENIYDFSSMYNNDKITSFVIANFDFRNFYKVQKALTIQAFDVVDVQFADFDLREKCLVTIHKTYEYRKLEIFIEEY